MPTGTPMPYVKIQFFDNNGDPASVHQLFSYAAGTTTKQDTFVDAALTTANANPIVLDSSGRAVIFLRPGVSYKFALALQSDTDPPLSPIWTIDNITAVPASTVDIDVTQTAGENLVAGDVVYMSQGDGARTAGRWYKADADTDYMSSRANALGFSISAITAGDTGSIRIAGRVTDLSGLSVGSVYYISTTAGSITASPTITARRRRLGLADSTSSLVISHWIPTEPYTLATFSATVGNVGAGEDTLASVTVSAALLNINGMSVRGVFSGKTANNANVKTLRVRSIEGANDTVLIAILPTISEAGEWLIGFQLMRSGAATSRGLAQALCGPTGGPVSKAVTAVNQPVATWANAVEIRLTGEATSDNDTTMESGVLTLVPGI